MTDETAPRTAVVDAEMLRGMTWDATIYTLTRPLALIAYTALVGALAINVVVLSLIGGADADRSSQTTWTAVAIAALIVASIVFTRASVRRALTTTMPSGSRVSAQVTDEKIRLFTKRGTSSMPYSTFRSARAGGHALILQLRGQSIITAIPRVLLTDDEIAAIKSRI